MNDFLRILQLSGVKLLLEALTPQQAANIFMQYGASDDDLSSPQKIKAARNRLIRQHHSDVSGGDDEAALDLRVHPRLDRPRRRRPDPPGGGACG